MRPRRSLSTSVCALCCFLLAGSVVAQPCVDYGEYVHWVAGVPMSGSAHDVALQGSFAYVADGAPGVQVVDIADPLHPEWRGSVDTPDVAWRLAVVGSLVYVATQDGGLQIVDVSHPDTPSLRGNAAFADAYDVAVAGNYAYVAESGYGVAVVDVVDPDHPHRVRAVDTEGYAYGVTVVGDRLYVADSWNGLLVFSLADPALPALLGGFDTEAANAVLIHEEFAAVADGSGGLRILDVTDPAHIVEDSSFPTCGDAWDLAVSPAGVGLVTCTGGINAFDTNDFTQIVDQGCVPFGDDAYGVAMAGDFAFVADDEWGLAVYAIPTALTTAGLGTVVDTSGYAVAVAVEDDHAYLAAQDSGLQIFELSDPLSPTWVATQPLPSFPTDAVVRDGLVYVSDYVAGLQIVDVTTPATPTVRGSLVVPGAAASLALRGNLAYLASSDSLRVIDVSDPAMPRQLRALLVVGEARAVAANFRGVFAVTDAGAIQWLRDGPGGLELRDSAQLDGHGAGIALQDSFVYAAWGWAPDGGVSVFAASESEQELMPVAQIQLPQFVNRIAFAHGLLYAAASRSVVIVDVHDPYHPSIVGAVANPPNDVQGVGLGDEGIYVANNLGGICALPRECLSYVPVFLASFGATPLDGAVTLSWAARAPREPGEFQLVATRDGATWDVPFTCSNEGAYAARDDDPRLSAGGTVEYSLRHRDADGAWLEVARRSVTLAPPTAVRLLAPRPNPFNPRTTIPFVLDRAREGRLTIHDQAGRLVAVLWAGQLAGGAHAITWDGRDACGRSVPSGVYFARLTTDGRIETRKLALLK